MTAGGALLAQLDGKATVEFSGYGWVEWCKFWTPVVLTWLGTILAFLDQTMGRLREKGEDETAFLRRISENQMKNDAHMRASEP